MSQGQPRYQGQMSQGQPRYQGQMSQGQPREDFDTQSPVESDTGPQQFRRQDEFRGREEFAFRTRGARRGGFGRHNDIKSDPR
jgi:hypothetical protein